MALMPKGFMPNGFAGVHHQIEDRVLHLDRMMQLQSELADEIHPKRMRARNADIDELSREPGEILVRQIGVRELLQKLA